jgi:hypothetical protein
MNNTETTMKASEGQITSQIDVAQISSVYSGINGRCCCGCSGKHTYAKAYQAEQSKRRGYEVEDDEVNDRTVKLICNKIMNAAPWERQDSNVYREYYAAVIGQRLYIAYVHEEVKPAMFYAA